MTTLTLYRLERGAGYDTLNAEKVWQGQEPDAASVYRSVCATALAQQGQGMLALSSDGRRLDVFRLAGVKGLVRVQQIDLERDYDLVRAFSVAGQPHVLCYAAETGTLQCYRMLPDLTLATVCDYRRTYGTVTTGFSVIEPYVYRGMMLLLAYNSTSGEAVIYQFQVTATEPLTIQQRWTAAWAPGWVRFALFSMGGEVFFLKSNTQHGDMVYIDHFADDAAQGSHPVGAHLPALPPTPRTAFVFDGTPYFAASAADDGITINRTHVDCQGWTPVARVAGSAAPAHLIVLVDGEQQWLLAG